MKHFTFLCVILAFYASERVRANSNSSQEVILMDKLNNVVEIFTENSIKKVEWNIFRAAVESIRGLNVHYNGMARDNIIALLRETTQADDEYLLAHSSLFQWCGSVKNDFSRTVSVIQTPNLPDGARSYISNRIKDSLLRGVMKAKDSIRYIEQAEQHTLKSVELLNVTIMMRNEDFSSNGYYGFKLSELVNERSKIKLNLGQISVILSRFGSLCTAILSFVADPVGIAMGLPRSLAAAGIPLAVVHGHTTPTLEQQITIIDEFFKKLQDALKSAEKECRKINEPLKTELADINQLPSDIETPQPDDVMIPEFSSSYVDSLNKLSVSCKRYVESHQSTPEDNHAQETITPLNTKSQSEAVAEEVPMSPGKHVMV